jgi:hypothetical protein
MITLCPDTGPDIAIMIMIILHVTLMRDSLTHPFFFKTPVLKKSFGGRLTVEHKMIIESCASAWLVTI